MSNHQKTERHIIVYDQRSVYVDEEGNLLTFEEGVLSKDAKKRLKAIKEGFDNNFLEDIILSIRQGNSFPDVEQVSESAKSLVQGLVDSVTSEVGRALVGLSILQLSIKSICPEQSVRLHKASTSRSSFSWSEGISMRSLDKSYVTPLLRKYDLLKVNADGCMMTRSLAENYPYSLLYKANLKGAKQEWLSMIEELESGKTQPLETLKFMISLLINRAEQFSSLVSEVTALYQEKSSYFVSKQKSIDFLRKHMESSDYSARLFEVSMHALLQAVVDSGGFGSWEIKPLSQMRSANKKHGNIGDVELLEEGDIVESWDAKYGKSYLREELEEASEKISNHDAVKIIGFVTSERPQRQEEIDNRVRDLTELHGIEFLILEYSEWVEQIFSRCIQDELVDEKSLSSKWIQIYVDDLCQKNRELAPIDEPCSAWVESLKGLLLSLSQS